MCWRWTATQAAADAKEQSFCAGDSMSWGSSAGLPAAGRSPKHSLGSRFPWPQPRGIPTARDCEPLQLSPPSTCPLFIFGRVQFQPTARLFRLPGGPSEGAGGAGSAAVLPGGWVLVLAPLPTAPTLEVSGSTSRLAVLLGCFCSELPPVPLSPLPPSCPLAAGSWGTDRALGKPGGAF